MKLLLLILTIYLLNGCSQKIPDCNPVPCIQNYPKLPTYKTPLSNNFAVVKHTEYNSIIENTDLLELVSNNKKLRRVCSNYAVINKRVNKEFE